MLDAPYQPAVVVVGIGNSDRGDDGAGRAAAHHLRGQASRDVMVLEHDGEATSLLAHLDGSPAVILIDACQSGAPAGTIRRFEVHDAPLPQARFGVSTHDFGLAAALELASALGQLPRYCVVYAIEGECFEAGAPPSPAVAAAVQAVVQSVIAEIHRLIAA